MERIAQIQFGDIELRDLDKWLDNTALTVMMFVTMRLVRATASGSLARLIGRFISPKRSLTVETRIECTVINDIYSFIKMNLPRSRRIRFASPVIQTEGHI